MRDTNTKDKLTHNIADETISLVNETVDVSKVEVIKREVVINKSTHVETTTHPVTLEHTEYVEKRIPKGEIISEMPQVRTEGDTTIIPVVREEAVVVKRLVLVEEIHFTKQSKSVTEHISVDLAKDEVTISEK